MKNAIKNDPCNDDIFVLDRDQTSHSDKRPSTPRPNHLIINQPRTTTLYKIVKTATHHVVLVQDEQPVDAVNVKDDQAQQDASPKIIQSSRTTNV